MSRRHIAGNSKDSKILAYKDMINQLNKTISAQTELIQSLQKTLEADRLEKENGELCPKSERHPDDLSGRRSLQFIQQS